MRSSALSGAFRLAAAACVLAGVVVATPASASSGQEIRLRDDCEPASFNAVLGPGACDGGGDTTLDEFNAELAQRHSVGAWKYDPDHTNVDRNGTVTVFNRGGETHTFTKVAAFGGGFVAPLNEASGNPTPAAECASVNPDGTLSPRPASATNQFVAAQTRVSAPALNIGTTLFQCCIHPWMRLRVDRR